MACKLDVKNGIILDVLKKASINNQYTYSLIKDNDGIPSIIKINTKNENSKVNSKEYSQSQAMEIAKNLITRLENKERYLGHIKAEIENKDRFSGIYIKITPSEAFINDQYYKQDIKDRTDPQDFESQQLNKDANQVVTDELKRSENSKVYEDVSATTLYQLANDKTRKKIDQKLNTFMKSLLYKLGVKVEDFDVYLSDYKKRNPGKDINMIAVADLYRNLIAYNKDTADGTTLSEETFHFIVDIFWNHPMIQDIRNLKTDGITFDFQNTDLYRNNYDEYMSLYKNQELVDKEVIAKLLAQKIYDEFKEEKFSTKVSNFLFNLLGKVFPRLAMKIRIAKQRVEGITEELNKILKDASIQTRSESFANNLTSRTITSGEIVETHSKFSEEGIKRLVNLLKAKKKNLEERVLGLMSEELHNQYDALVAIHGSLLVKDINDKLNVLLKKPVLTNLDKQTIKELNEYLILQKSIGRDEANIEKIKVLSQRIKVIEQELSKKKFEAGIFMFFYGPDGDGSLGAIEDINTHINYIDQVSSGNTEMDIHQYALLVESTNFYTPVIETLNNLYKNKSFSFPELTPENNDKLKKTLTELNDNQLADIKRFLTDNAYNQVKKEYEKYYDINPNLKKRTLDSVLRFYDTGILNLWAGAAQNAKEDWLGIFNKKIVDTMHKIELKTNNTFKELANNLYEDLQSIGDKGIKKLSEKDDTGKKTGYWLNPYKIHKWVKNREKHYDTIINKLDKYSAGTPFKLKIPKDRTARHRFFSGEFATTPAILNHVKVLENLYNKEWAQWFSENSMAHPDATAIIAKKKASMSITKFNIWYNNNVKKGITYENGQEVSYTYYAGELSIPSNGTSNVGYKGNIYNTVDYTNPAYNALTSQEKKVLEGLKAQYDIALQGIPVIHSYESTNRLPQITKSKMDILYGGFKGISDKITDSFIPKPDDDLFADREFGSINTIVDRPRIQYITLLDNPDNITDDLFMAVANFTQMSNHYQEFMHVITDLNGMIDIAKQARTTPGKIMKFFSKEDVIKPDSNIVKKMEHLKRVHILGEHMTKSESEVVNRLTKFATNFKGYIVNNRLMGSLTSVAKGFGSATIDTFIETALAKYINPSSMKRGHNLYASQLVQIVKDFSTPIKSSKLSLMANEFNLVNELELNFSNLSRSRVTRTIGNTLDWGMWRMADVAVKYPLMAAVADNIRMINGKPYTKHSWSMEMKENNSLTMDQYNTAKNFYDLITVVDGIIKYDPSITQEAINLFKNTTKVVTSRIDGQPLKVDKGMIYNHAIAQFLTITNGFLFQMLERGFKSEQFNYLTQQTEVGWWTALYNTGFLNILNITNWKEMYQTAEPHEQEQILRVAYMSAATSVLFMAAYILNAIMLGGDDDEDPELKYITYITTGMLLEKESVLSIGDILRYIANPMQGVDNLQDYFNQILLPLVLVFNTVTGGKGKEVENGIYAGYDQNTKDLIKSVPLLRGWFETMYGGYINEALDKPKTSIATSIQGKNEFMKNKIVNGGGGLTDLPLGLPIKVLSKLPAQFISEQVSEYPRSSGITSLPTKKANKEQN
jgi:hypothetical protein